MNIKPIGERVLLVPPQHNERTSGGLYIPESAQQEKKEGKVVAVGTFKDGSPLPLKAGDKVLYGGYSSDEFEIHGERYVVVEYKDVLATLGDE